MSSYYGVTRSSEYLAHYGVRGMKWGFKKAIKKAQKKFKNRKYFTNQDFKDAFKAGLVGAAFGPYAGLGYTVTKQNQRIANEIPANNNRHGKRNRRS